LTYIDVANGPVAYPISKACFFIESSILGITLCKRIRNVEFR